MKQNWFTLILCLLLTSNAHALIVNINGHGEIPAEGMELTVTEAPLDPLTGKATVELDGSLLCNGPLTVNISRSMAGVEDEFCCAGQCTSGNGQLTETLEFTPGGMASWFTHFKPAASFVTVVYTFSDGAEELVLTVHYNVTQDIETVSGQKQKARKIIRDGLLWIEYNDKIYNL